MSKGFPWVGILCWSDLGACRNWTESAASWTVTWVIMMKNARDFTAYQTQLCLKVNNWGTSFTTSRVTYFGRIMLSIFNHLVCQPTRRKLPRRYCNGHHEVFRRRCWIRLQKLASKVLQLGDCSSVDYRSSPVERNLLMEFISINLRRIGQYCSGLRVYSIGITIIYYHVVDVALAPMCRHRCRHSTTSNGKVVRLLWCTDVVGLCWLYDG